MTKNFIEKALVSKKNQNFRIHIWQINYFVQPIKKKFQQKKREETFSLLRTYKKYIPPRFN